MIFLFRSQLALRQLSYFCAVHVFQLIYIFIDAREQVVLFFALRHGLCLSLSHSRVHRALCRLPSKILMQRSRWVEIKQPPLRSCAKCALSNECLLPSRTGGGNIFWWLFLRTLGLWLPRILNALYTPQLMQCNQLKKKHRKMANLLILTFE